MLISASAGFGKSTLVSAWVADCARGEPKVRAAWLALDEGDNDLTRFLSYLVAALQTLALPKVHRDNVSKVEGIAPSVGAGVLAALESPQPPPAETLLTALINELAAIPESFVLVLDDYHVIDAKPVDEALAFLVEHLPPQMHLVIATREDPHLPLARLRVRGQLTELRAAELRFTAGEAAEFLNRTMGLGLAADDVAALEARTEGWIASLQLAALALQGSLSLPGRADTASFIRSFTGTHHFMMDYLLEEVLQQQTAEVQAFLLGTSLLDRLCGPLCDAVMEMGESANQRITNSPHLHLRRSAAQVQVFADSPFAHSHAILEYLERANLFIVPLDNDRQWYRYHRLFADLLRQRLQQSTADVADYHRRASHWYEANGHGSLAGM
jgi:LuxR family maltose regulon positive regulatory protein